MGEYIPGAPISDEARRRNGSLPGMGGVFNLVNLHVYHYAGNNPVKYIDPDGRVSKVYKIGNTLLIIIPVQYAKGATEAQKQQYQKAAESYWSGTFGDHTVKLKVIETSTGERNSIEFSDEIGTSYVLSGKDMVLYREDTTKEEEWVAGHETGHLMGLDDRYIEGNNPDGSRKTAPEEGWGKNIMAEFWGKTEERNIDSVLEKNKVIDTESKHRADGLH
jgi:hypothetical protein